MKDWITQLLSSNDDTGRLSAASKFRDGHQVFGARSSPSWSIDEHTERDATKNREVTRGLVENARVNMSGLDREAKDSDCLPGIFKFGGKYRWGRTEIVAISLVRNAKETFSGEPFACAEEGTNESHSYELVRRFIVKFSGKFLFHSPLRVR